MPKPKDAQGYDVAGTAYRQHEDPRASLAQAFADYRTPNPTSNFTYKMGGDTVTISMHCHERGLGDPTRRAGQIDAMSKAMDLFVKGLKARHRELGAGTLSLEEEKNSRGHRLDKVSLNDRWDIVYHRTYKVEGLIGLPEKN